MTTTPKTTHAKKTRHATTEDKPMTATKTTHAKNARPTTTEEEPMTTVKTTHAENTDPTTPEEAAMTLEKTTPATPARHATIGEAPATAPPATATTTAAAPPATATTTAPAVVTPASRALAAIKTIATWLSLDDGMTPAQLLAAKGVARVPIAAMVIAVNVLDDNPGQFPQFDGAGLQAAIDYEQSMEPVVEAMQALLTRIQRSVMKGHAAAATETLAFYAVIKGTARLSKSGASSSRIKAMGDLLATRRKSRATQVTNKETAQFEKTSRSQKKAQVAQNAVDEASTKAALAGAQASLDAGILPSSAPSNVAPVAPAPTAGAGVSGATSPTPGH